MNAHEFELQARPAPLPGKERLSNTWVVQKLIRMGLYDKVTSYIPTTFTPK